ncbi:Uncharacterised protein [uncultured archaeon]|nr:Uncharacterised protein [uncultured archaeon]
MSVVVLGEVQNLGVRGGSKLTDVMRTAECSPAVRNAEVELIVKKAAILLEGGDGEGDALPIMVRRGDDLGEDTLKKVVHEVLTKDKRLIEQGVCKVGKHSSMGIYTDDDLVVLVRPTHVKKVRPTARVMMSGHERDARTLLQARGANFFVLFPKEVAMALDIPQDNYAHVHVSFESVEINKAQADSQEQLGEPEHKASGSNYYLEPTSWAIDAQTFATL